jgi:GDP-mannose 4,6 dehydratase
MKLLQMTNADEFSKFPTFFLSWERTRHRLKASVDMSEERKVALVTGITGQDGSYLAEFLLEKGYVVSVPVWLHIS